MRIFRKLAQMLDVNVAGVADGDALVYDQATGKWVPGAGGGGGGGAPTDVDYLVGTGSGDLSAEIVVGTSPGGELGGTWASPTVDATHSGSSHASVQAAAEATAAGALSAHSSDTTGVHGIADTSALVLTNDSRLSDSRAPNGSAGGVLSGTYPNPGFAADMATQAELDAHVNDTSAAHAASAISADSTTLVGTGTDVQAVLEELDNGIADHLADSSAAHAASAISFSPTGNIAATDAQAAIAEAATDAASALSTHEADTTSVHGITDTSTLYRSGGTDVALADGGTGASLTDPNADRIMFWDDSAGAVTWLTPGTGLTITSTTIDASGGGSGSKAYPVQLLNPRVSSLAGNSFFTVLGLSDWDAGHWEFVKDVDGKVYGQVRVPPAYSSGGTLRLAIAANATSGVTRLGVGTKAVADGESLNPTLTDETKQDITVPGTAYLRKDVTFTLTETLAADDLLLIEIFHEGTHTNDTLAVNTLLLGAWLEVTA